MRGNSLFVLFALLTDSVYGMCTSQEKDVLRLCEKSTAEFEAVRGKMWVQPDDVRALELCTCTIQTVNQHVTDFVLVSTGAGNSEDIPVNFSVTHGNKTLTDRSSDVIFTTTVNSSDEVTLVFQRRRESSSRDADYQYCFGFAQIKERNNLSISCKASFESDPEPPEESEASLGAILGPTISMFILVDIAVIGVVYYLMKRRVNTSVRWRPTIEHTVSHMKDTSLTIDNPGAGGNNYVGYRSKPQTGVRPVQPVGDEYEDVGRPSVITQSTNLDILLPQKKQKSWFFFKKDRSSVFSQKDLQKGEEYEEVQTSQVEIAKKQLIQPAGNLQPESYTNVNKLGDQFGRQKNQPKKPVITSGNSVSNESLAGTPGISGQRDLQSKSDVEWTPADAYEEVNVTTKKPDEKNPNEGFAPKDSYETMEDLKSGQAQRSKGQFEKKTATVVGSRKPSESYEDMHPPVQRPAKKEMQKTQGGSERFKTDTKKPYKIAKSTSFKIPESRGQIPNTTYDNMESWTKHQSKTADGRRKVTPPESSAEKTETQGVRPTEDYDNIEIYAKQSTSRPRGKSENQAITQQPSQRRKRTQTEPPAPSQVYDNFNHIAEQKRLARSESRRANVKKT